MQPNLPIKLILFLFLFLTLGSFSTALGEGSFYSVGVSIAVEDPAAATGSIVSFVEGKYVLSSTEYDNLMAGVIVDAPNLSIVDKDLVNAKLMASSGEALVLVSTANGEIKKGDYLTSSTVPGVAMKADKTGQILGVALEDYSSGNPNDTAKINALIDIKAVFGGDSSVRANLLRTLKSGISAPFLTPVDSLRYTLSAIIIGSTFLVGFTSFSRLSGNSMHALGRNPLASRQIRTALLFNFFLTLVVMVIGFGISYFMLVY